MAVGRDRLKRIVSHAEQHGAVVLLENLNKEPDDAEIHYLAHTVEEWRYYFDAIQSHPPPHPITVYASHPPSPTTAQHSLPGGALPPYRGRSFTGRIASASPDAPEPKVRIQLPPAESLQTFGSRSRRPADYRTRHAGYGVKAVAWLHFHYERTGGKGYQADGYYGDPEGDE